MSLTWNTNFSGKDDVIGVQTIFQKGKTLRLQQRFFDSELSRSRESSDMPISFTASSCRSGFVEFRADRKWSGWRVTYTRTGDVLRVEGVAGYKGGLGHFSQKMSRE